MMLRYWQDYRRTFDERSNVVGCSKAGILKRGNIRAENRAHREFIMDGHRFAGQTSQKADAAVESRKLRAFGEAHANGALP